MVKSFETTRRLFLQRGAAAGLVSLPSVTVAQQMFKEIHELKPGEFTWHPDRSPVGPVAIVVSIPGQLVHVYRNGIRIAVSTCSTGKPGHETPTGVFTVLEKDKRHFSSTYNNAPMPNMNRLTWSGIALHAGQLPGYPASHGCVRLPLAFSDRLFSVTHVGTPVIIAGRHSDPRELTQPGLVLSDVADHRLDEAVAKLKTRLPPATGEVATSVLVSRADSTVMVVDNGVVAATGRAFIEAVEKPLGSHVFVLSGEGSDRNLAWHSIAHHEAAAGGAIEPDAAVIGRIKADPAVVEAINARLHPGTILITTDLPLHPDSRSGRDFVIMTHDEA